MGWITGWTYRKSHTINPASGSGQNYQKRVVVHFGAGVDSGEDVYLDGKCLANFGDIRFTNSSGAFLLDYWLDKKVDSNYAIYWVEVADDLNTYNRKIHVYYGNAGATSIANGDATFIFFDDFETNLNKWSALGTTGLRFSGSNNLGSPLGFGTIGDFDGYSPFTLECWFKTTNTGENPLITRMNLGGNYRGYCLFVINNHIGYELRNTSGSNDLQIETNVRTINDGNKHHLIATYDGSQQASGIHIYLDGTEEPFTTLVNTLNGTISNPSRFNVATYGGFYWFTGDIDEVVVYTSVLTLSDVVARYNNGEGTEDILSGVVYAHWPLDEGAGTDVIDVSGHPDRNLWLATAGGPLPSWVAGMVGAPTVSNDHSYSGLKSVKIPATVSTSAIFKVLGGPNIAIHTHCYDLVSPLSEAFEFLTTAGGGKDAFIGVQNDLSDYEYCIDGANIYSSGVSRTIGWHEFVMRCIPGSKQFLIDGNLMPNEGPEDIITFFLLGTGQPPVVNNSYWDAFFIRKFVSPEPSDGVWGAEETGSGVTTFVAEDIENTILRNVLQLDDIIYPLAQKPLNMEDALLSLLSSLHMPDSSEDLLVALPESLHVPDLSEDLLVVLAKEIRSSEDLIPVLFSLLHIPHPSEDIIASLAKIKNLRVEDLVFALSSSPHVSFLSDDVTMSLLTKRLRRVLMDLVTTVGSFPIIGGSHIIQVE